MKTQKVFQLIMAILICQLAGVIGSIFTYSSIPLWYAGLTKPAFNPPNWIFGPVWISLYTLMGVSAFIIFDKAKDLKEGKLALKVFASQLVLNSLWSIIFFGLRAPMLAFFEIILLLALIAASIYYFYRISKLAAALLVPYVLWVGFAAILNLSIAILNA